MFLIIYEVNTKILNFAFCILHLGDSPINYNLSFHAKSPGIGVIPGQII